MASPQRTPNVLYEPRALWEVRQLLLGGTQQGGFDPGPVSFNLNRRRWRNGRRHTLVLTHVLLDGVGYALNRNDDTVAGSSTQTHNARSVLANARLRISSPFRSYLSRMFISFGGLEQQPAHEPPMDFVEGALDYASGPFGISRWDFRDTCPEGPFWIPNKSRAQFDVSGWLAPAVGVAAQELDGTEPQITAMFDECPIEGYALRQPGVARLSERTRFRAVDSTDVFPAGPNPMPFDAFGGNAMPPGTGAISMWQHKLITPDLWRGDESARGVTHKELRGFAVQIDQIGYDDELNENGQAGVAGQPLAPLSTKVGTRCRMTGGGSGEWWWEPGAPLSLVSPTLGPALVHRLNEPIVLPKGDALDVEVEIPDLVSDGRGGQVNPRYNVGISMLGYARVEG